MSIGAGLYMYNVVVKKFTFAISSPDEFLVLISLLKTKINTMVVTDVFHFGTEIAQLGKKSIMQPTAKALDVSALSILVEHVLIRTELF